MAYIPEDSFVFRRK